MNRGFLFAVAAYLSWGLLPIYWKSLQALPPLEIMGHRIIWSLLFVAVILSLRRQWDWVRHLGQRTLWAFLAISVLISVNWFTYIWAVNDGHVVETSLGYFINPLVNVLLGSLFLGERLRRLQLGAVAIAAGGVLYLTISYGSLPWIALTLAFTFGFYGLLKKTAVINSLEGFALEMALLLPIAAIYLFVIGSTGEAAFSAVGLNTQMLMIGSGVITAIPLLCFAAAARRITLTTLGLFQYLAPTMQFCLGIFLYNEPFSLDRMIGFSLIWLALALYSLEGILHNRHQGMIRYRERVGTVH